MSHQPPIDIPSNEFNRRKFLLTATRATGAALLLGSPLAVLAASVPGHLKDLTVGEIMDLFTSEVNGAPFSDTVDTLKAGNRAIKVTGVVTTMFATLDVIQQAINLGANFIISHEPAFYNHKDETGWLEKDDVYLYKARLLAKHNVALWRNHDYIHAHKPDGVMTAVLARLGWTKQYDETTSVVTLPPLSLQALIAHAKKSLAIDKLRYIGDLSQPCKRVLLIPGAYGGKGQITAVSKQQPDVLVCGEVQEWETAEYIRDAQIMGKQLSLVVLGHITSEEPGSAYMANWIKEKLPALKVAHIPAKDSLSFL